MSSAQSMPCPVCKVSLVMSERQGVEIDYCPQCRGVWLDRGELDKIIERAAQDLAPAQPAQQAPSYAPQQPQRQAPYGHDRGYSEHKGYPKKRKSFLQELFD